jgi:hypothetical protein
MILVNRSPDRHGGSPLSFGFGYRFSELRECLMDGRNQCPELIGPDLVSPNICSNDIGSEFLDRVMRRAVRQPFWLSGLTETIACRASQSDDLGSP